MKLKKLIITFFLLPAAFGYAQTQSTQIIAHRGFWKTNGSAQNSIAALMKADSVVLNLMYGSPTMTSWW